MVRRMLIQRNTVQRQIVSDALKKLKIHPSIDEVYAAIHKNHPSISKTTVARNLRQLAENGLVRQISTPDGEERYDYNTEPHYHFQCAHCQNIMDVDIEYLAGVNDAVQNKYGVRVQKHDMVFSGVCQKCVNH